MASATQSLTIPGYEIVRRVPDRDREVYLAHPTGREQTGVVLVVAELERADARRFEHEVRRCMTIEHPAFANIVDYFEDGDRQVVAFEHVEGTSLHRLLRYVNEQDERLGDGAVLHIGVGLLAALNEAHSAKTDDGKAAPLIHGQLGPHQVLISWEGEVKVMGFGLGLMFEKVGEVPAWLTPFVAPEVRDGRRHTARANVYAAGAMLWTLLARERLPADGSRPTALRKVRPDLPPSVTFPLDRALEPDPQKRISAKALQVGLSRAIEDADREELRWAMEVCRVRCTVEEEFLPQESLPPSSFPATGHRSSQASDSDAPTGVADQHRLLDKARLIGPLPWESELLDEETNNTDKKRPSVRRRPAPRHRRGRRELDAASAAASTSEPADSDRAGAGPTRPAGADPSARSADQDLGGLGSTIAIPAPGQMQPVPEERTIPAPARQRLPTMGLGPIPAPPLAPRESDVTFDDEHDHDHEVYPEHSSQPPSYPVAGPHGYHPSQFPPGFMWSGGPPSSIPPGSAYPYPAVSPSGHVVPTLGYPLSMPPPAAGPPSLKWVLGISFTSVACFVIGLMAASSGLRLGSEAPTTPPAAAAPPPVASAPPTAQPAPEPATPAAAPPADASVAATSEPEPADPPPTSDPEAAEAPSAAPEGPSVVTTDDAAALPAHRAFLRVHTDIKGAHVYVHGNYAGPAEEVNEVDCGMRFVRLGGAQSMRDGWLEPGRAVQIPCRTLMTVTIEPRPTPASWASPRQFLR